jgi:hypothetical protein
VVFLIVVALSHIPALAVREAAVMEELQLHHRGLLILAALVLRIQAAAVVGVPIMPVLQIIKVMVAQEVPAWSYLGTQFLMLFLLYRLVALLVTQFQAMLGLLITL